jgi:hypothetical protein
MKAMMILIRGYHQLRFLSALSTLEQYQPQETSRKHLSLCFGHLPLLPSSEGHDDQSESIPASFEFPL